MEVYMRYADRRDEFEVSSRIGGRGRCVESAFSLRPTQIVQANVVCFQL